ncbi:MULTISPECIES: DUF4351 domain-containing protein [Thiorhodovibrio]|uniref:DUF4351 domain-containing protein n=1 Tax=Thiorhodovibrio TaxID=61593 RepID=UPI001912EB19|nr:MULTISPECIES: DUF4351 domain-containing protein [Thiorhodovibrio]MBK5969034.1 hypothetical protein [Thiorhodovibrio winogradskyi]WPL15085.1 hypothetical protein Thiosp_04949 [Thiorhodovibrio litoralis]
MSHDQNFKNLILDYPRQAIEFAAASEAARLDDQVRILPLREEQLKERLGERFRELDVPLLLEWPDGRRQALLFVFEEETEPGRFSIHRLAHYCLDLSELYQTERVVPVVIFLHPGGFRETLSLGSDTRAYLQFSYLACALFGLKARDYFDSPNLVARLNLPNMQYAPEEKVEVYAQAVRGLRTLEPDRERQIKYLDFVDIYAALDENERQRYQQQYAEEIETMTAFADRFIEQGVQQGVQQGLQQGEARTLLRQLDRKFGSQAAQAHRARIEAAELEQLETWLDRILTAETPETIFH